MCIRIPIFNDYLNENLLESENYNIYPSFKCYLNEIESLG